jgi:cystathionine beta-lyase
MAAADAAIKLLNPGDEVVSTNDLYGGTYRMFTKVFARYGIKFTFVDMRNLDNIAAAITPATKMLWIETPTNPMLGIVDIEGAVALARKHNLISVVDNTFASPCLQNPLDLGADIVQHSITKYLGGHSDVVMGCLVTSSDDLHERLAFLQNACGAVCGPMDSFLVLRGIKTLHLRMRQHCENGRRISQWLMEHPLVDQVFYPGLAHHQGHEVAKRQMRDFGGMMSFTLKGDDIEHANRVMRSTHLFACAESLGGVESLIGHPATMTHASIPREERLKSGLKDTLIRLSVGVEDADDLIADLDQALRA